MATAEAVTIVLPGQGRAVDRRYGEQTVLKAGETETREASAVREPSVPAGFGGVPFHLHQGEEAFSVLEGMLTVHAEGRTLAANYARDGLEIVAS